MAGTAARVTFGSKDGFTRTTPPGHQHRTTRADRAQPPCPRDGGKLNLTAKRYKLLWSLKPANLGKRTTRQDYSDLAGHLGTIFNGVVQVAGCCHLLILQLPPSTGTASRRATMNTQIRRRCGTVADLKIKSRNLLRFWNELQVDWVPSESAWGDPWYYPGPLAEFVYL